MLGICHNTGWPIAIPTLPLTPYTDYIAPWYALVAIIGALARRHRTGKGMYIDQSQYEAGLHAMAPHLMDYIVNGNVINRMGNRDRYMCPHGIYPVAKADTWPSPQPMKTNGRASAASLDTRNGRKTPDSAISPAGSRMKMNSTG